MLEAIAGGWMTATTTRMSDEEIRRTIGISTQRFRQLEGVLRGVKPRDRGGSKELGDRWAQWLYEKYLMWKAQAVAEAERIEELRGSLTTYDVARVLGISTDYVFQLRWRGMLEYSRKVGRTYEFHVDDVLKIFDMSETRMVRAFNGEVGPQVKGPLGHAFLRSLEVDGDLYGVDLRSSDLTNGRDA
jgi:hypothetical protein